MLGVLGGLFSLSPAGVHYHGCRYINLPMSKARFELCPPMLNEEILLKSMIASKKWLENSGSYPGSNKLARPRWYVKHYCLHEVWKSEKAINVVTAHISVCPTGMFQW